MSADVLLAAEATVAAFEQAGVLVVSLGELADEAVDLERGHARLDDAGGDVGSEVVEQGLTRRECDCPPKSKSGSFQSGAAPAVAWTRTAEPSKPP